MIQSPTPAPSTAPGIERLFVSVGTDFHRFDRLILWLDEWLGTGPLVHQSIVQRGTSNDSQNADESLDYIPRSRLIEEFQKASVVVCHGGPATILECRSNGIVPIVVPREAHHNEHVNDHQVDFCVRLAAHDEIQLARTKDEFFALLDTAVERGAPEVAVDDGHTVESLERFEDAMVDLLGQRARSLPSGDMADVVNLKPGDAPIPVIFIGAVPRSGSTLISDLLDQHPHMVNVGEVVHMWERGLDANEKCGCGESFTDCVFWQKVGDLAFGGWEKISAQRMIVLKNRIDRTRFIPALLSPVPLPPVSTSMQQYGAVLSRILRAAIEVSGSPVVIDTSKHVSTALLLRRVAKVDLRIVHLVRDPRGVAHSWTKRVARPEGDDEMHRLHPARVGMRWLWFNWAFSNMNRLDVPVQTIRYEDFVAEPQETLNQIFSFAGVEPSADHIMSADGQISTEPGHSVSGNPRRFDTSPVSIRPDDAWKKSLARKHRQLVSRITTPLRARYGYGKEQS